MTRIEKELFEEMVDFIAISKITDPGDVVYYFTTDIDYNGKCYLKTEPVGTEKENVLDFMKKDKKSFAESLLDYFTGSEIDTLIKNGEWLIIETYIRDYLVNYVANNAIQYAIEGGFYE